jgi:hypothetical protein
MNDLDALREALRGETGEGALDIQVIVTKGRRLRCRRRLTVAGGAMCVAAVTFGAVAGIGHSTGSPPVPAQRPVSPAGSTHRPPPRHEPIAKPTAKPAVAPAPTASASPAAIPSAAATTSAAEVRKTAQG